MRNQRGRFLMSKMFSQRELTMLTDFYEITMANGYFLEGFKDTICYFDMFFRKLPDNGGFAIMAGVEQLVEYLKNLHFSTEDIEYLSGRHMFSGEFLEYQIGRASCRERVSSPV